eukprot:TRINITY_DN7334_c0_g2_i1.p1 TRINITY_DN7334_c0_g2~~TRINITY_DN7334_c0_g2_i1.p1  ORF type:complete len:303 (+),score=60.78 TRINITY_DN7334_c0_g2_i1:230-1138(+)
MSRLHAHFIRQSALRAQWVKTALGPLTGMKADGERPGLLWAHGLGGSCAADDLRGLTQLLSPENLGGHAVLRLDLRGHGLSRSAHQPSKGLTQYTWQSQAEDFRQVAAEAAAASDGKSLLAWGGEASGAGLVLNAAAKAQAQYGAEGVPASLVLMRPPLMWEARIPWKSRYELSAGWAEADGLQGKDVEGESRQRLIGANFAGSDSVKELMQEWASMDPSVYIAALRGLAASELPNDSELRNLKIPTLILAVPGDAEHPVEAAEDLAMMLPEARLVVSRSLAEAKETWPEHIREVLSASKGC